MATEKRLLIDLQGVNMDEVDTSDCTDVEDILSAVITYLSEQPVVDAVEVVHGQWVDMGDFQSCSICKAARLKEIETLYGKAIWVKTPFCPNCGAKMDGDGNGT